MQYGFLLLPYIFLLTLGFFGWWYFDPASYGWILGGISLAYLLGAWWLDQTRADWWRFAVTPLLLAVSGLVFSLLVAGNFSALVILGLVALLELLYWRYAYLYAARPGSYAPFSLERYSASLNFLTVYFLSAAAYGLQTFLAIPSWIIAAIFAVLICLLWTQWLWVGKISRTVGWRYAVAASVVMIELFLLQNFSPLDFRLLAFPVATGYYTLLTLMSLRMSGGLQRRKIYLLLAIMIISWAAVFLSARWF